MVACTVFLVIFEYLMREGFDIPSVPYVLFEFFIKLMVKV